MENNNGEPIFTFIKIYLVRDAKQGVYLPPTCAVHLTEISRALTEIVNNPQHKFGKYTSDFELYYNGTMNEMTGEITSPEKPEFVLNLTELIIQPKKEATT